MARIRNLEAGQQDLGPHRSEVDCFYQRVLADDGSPLLHLSTFGSDNRASAPKSSQSIQLDEEQGRRLIEIILEVFPGIR
ncbi:hypothetical protein NLM24_48625 [Nocardia zapadnayensis]|nr:hypothetical protein [Nocardia zapadnayensis]MCX0278268.1 hypothetical protein [Nocardia zapadnayensis]